MTINEVEHAIRNLLVSQPMITATPIGNTVTSILSTIETYKNFKLSIQSYPSQDSFKFITLNECQRFENTFSISICQSLQEKGINLMVYMTPENSFPAPNPYNPVHPAQNQAMLNQLSFNQPPISQQRPPMWQYQQQFSPMNDMQNSQFGANRPMPPKPPMNGTQMFNRSNQQPFNNQSPYNPQFADNWKKPFSQNNTNIQSQSVSLYNNLKPAPPVNSNFESEPTIKKSAKLNEVEIMKPMANTKPKTSLKSKKKTETVQIQINEPEKIAVEEEPETEEAPPSKAAGRDYLLKLLKNK